MKISNPIAKLGEDLACEYLKTHKYTILERNFHAKGGEIDIIGVDNSDKEPILCFAEVKTRRSTAFGTPFEAISSWKLQAVQKTAIYYTILHKNLPKSLRIDAIAVILTHDNQVKSIELLKNITQ